MYFSRRNLSVEFRCRGGARTNYLEVPANQQQYDVIILVIGSNNLGDGIAPSSVYASLKGYANQYTRFAVKVVIMTVFPRHCTRYMNSLTELNDLITRHSNNTIVGWRWSKKFDRHMILRSDGVHLTDKAYKKACKYLVSPVMLFFKPSSKQQKL